MNDRSAAPARYGPTDDQILLSGPEQPAEHPSEVARLTRMHDEIASGFAALAGLGPAVSVFGSARTARDHPSYDLARRMARELGEAGLAVITGGGPGIMEAANRGAREAGAVSVGLNIELPHEEEPNDYLDLSLDFRYFFARRIMFVRYACAFVVHPGGLGTLDEMFEALTLIQTEKIDTFPVALVGTAHWRGLIDWMGDRLSSERLIDESDLTQLLLTDDIASVVEHVSQPRPGQ